MDVTPQCRAAYKPRLRSRMTPEGTGPQPCVQGLTRVRSCDLLSESVKYMRLKLIYVQSASAIEWVSVMPQTPWRRNDLHASGTVVI
jgi:hypothetical protein